MTRERTPSPRLGTEARFLSRSLGKRASKFLIVLLAISTGVSVLATAWNLSPGLSAQLAGDLRSHGPNALIVAGGAPFEDPSERLRRAAEGGESTQVAPLLSAVGRTARGGFGVSGVDFAATRLLGDAWSVAGTWPSDPGECLCGSRLAQRLGIVAGANVEFEVGTDPAAPLACRVSGLVTTGESGDEELMVALPLLQEATGRRGLVSAVALRIGGGREEIAATLARLGSVPGIPPPQLLRAASESEGRLLDRLGRMMTLLGLLILSLSGLCVMTTLIALVVEREPEIGLMRSLGAGDGDVARMLLGEAALLGLAGGLLGWGIGAVAARVLSRALLETPVTPHLSVLPSVVGVAILLCAAGVVLPLRRALSVRPAVALKGE
jgi:putative ABC transport system permease protein